MWKIPHTVYEGCKWDGGSSTVTDPSSAPQPGLLWWASRGFDPYMSHSLMIWTPWSPWVPSNPNILWSDTRILKAKSSQETQVEPSPWPHHVPTFLALLHTTLKASILQGQRASGFWQGGLPEWEGSWVPQAPSQLLQQAQCCTVSRTP